MAKRNTRDRDDVNFDENVASDAVEQEVAEGETAKRPPSRRFALRSAIVNYVVEHAGELTGELGDMANELAALPVRKRSTGTGQPSRTKRIREMILEQREVHEDAFYNEFKLGRLEMKRTFYNMRKKVADPANAVWVSFDPETGIYKLEGTGAETPAGFDE